MDQADDNRTTASVRLRRSALVAALALSLAAPLIGCGGAEHRTKSVPTISSTSKRFRTVAEGPARAACERAVRTSPRLPSSAKPEIAGLCWRINIVVEDNEKTVHSICQEVANASPVASEADKRQIATACYANGLDVTSH